MHTLNVHLSSSGAWSVWIFSWLISYYFNLRGAFASFHVSSTIYLIDSRIPSFFSSFCFLSWSDHSSAFSSSSRSSFLFCVFNSLVFGVQYSEDVSHKFRFRSSASYWILSSYSPGESCNCISLALGERHSIRRPTQRIPTKCFKI